MSRVRALPLLLAVALLLAGCASKEEPVAVNEVAPGIVSGTVTDAALTPLVGVNVSVEGTNESALTDAAGAFRLLLPPGEHLLLATFEGYRVAALRANVVSDATAALAFTLDPIPREEPSSMSLEAEGLLGCRVLVDAGGERTLVPCGQQDPNERTRLAFPVTTVDALGGAVVEVVWEPRSAAGRALAVTVSRGASEEALVLGASEGEGRAVISLPSRLLAEMAAGDELLVDVTPAGSLTDEEANVDAALVIQQPFTVYVTLFYRQEPPGGFSVLDG